VIYLFPGGTNEVVGTLQWNKWISLMGFGARTSTVRTPINLLVTPGNPAAASFTVFSNVRRVVRLRLTPLCPTGVPPRYLALARIYLFVF